MHLICYEMRFFYHLITPKSYDLRIFKFNHYNDHLVYISSKKIDKNAINLYGRMYMVHFIYDPWLLFGLPDRFTFKPTYTMKDQIYTDLITLQIKVEFFNPYFWGVV